MIYLKSLTESDLPFLLEIRNDESTRSMLGNDTRFTLSECEHLFNSTQPKWKMISYNDNPNVGYIRIEGNSIGIDIDQCFRRKVHSTWISRLYKKWFMWRCRKRIHRIILSNRYVTPEFIQDVSIGNMTY